VLEALAMEVPVVASALAAGGLRTPEGQDPPLTVVDGPAATAAAVVAALQRVEADPTPAAEGRAFVAAHFSWRRSGESWSSRSVYWPVMPSCGSDWEARASSALPSNFATRP